MGNEEHRQILSRGIGIWNRWRNENPSIVPDLGFGVFQGANLARADFSSAGLYCAWLEGADLSGANFHSADLAGARFSDADLSQADLSESLYLTQTQVNEASGDEQTLLPQGLSRPERWLRHTVMQSRG